MTEWMDEGRNGWMDGMNGWMDGWMNEWMDGWMDHRREYPEISLNEGLRFFFSYTVQKRSVK